MNAPHAPSQSFVPLRNLRFFYSPDMVPGLYRFADLALIALCGAITHALVPDITGNLANLQGFAVVFYLVVFNFPAKRAQLYDIDDLVTFGARIDDLLIVNLITLMLLLSVVVTLVSVQGVQASWLYGFSAACFGFQTVLRLAGCAVLRRMAARRIIGRNVAILGDGEQARRLLRLLDRVRPLFTQVVGVFNLSEAAAPDAACESRPVLGGIDALLAAARDQQIDDVVVALPWAADRQILETIERLKELPINVYLLSDLAGFELSLRPTPGDLATLPLFEVAQKPIAGWNRTLKAVEDYALTSIILIVIAPLLVVIALAVKLDSPGPVFFKQRRLGFNNREFEIFKFRSMYHADEPEREVRQAHRNDPRITRVGRIIRRTSLDELPQLLNVLNGTMSLVGPRPHAVEHNKEYSRKIRGYFARHNVKPGITGWAQVNGLRGETETIDKMEARIRHDIYYTENWSISFDLRILIRTAMVVPFQKSAY